MSTLIKDKFVQENIVTDVIDTSPKDIVKVAFGVKEVVLGNELTPKQVANAPNVNWKYEVGKYYTVIFTDPDAPSRVNPIRREFLHWLIVNVPGDDITKGDILAEFVSSAPPKDSDLHRYTFLVFQQPDGRMTFNEQKIPNNTREGRRCFSTRNFSKCYNLGQPIAGNYYLAQWDEYVEEVNKTFV